MNIFELIHNSGQVYNDLKPDNILIGINDKIPRIQSSYQNLFENVSIKLADFGLASKWRDSKTGKHVDRKQCEFFQGNIYFSSVNQLSQKTASRRDDMHSLVYFLIYLINKCAVPVFDSIWENDANKTEDWVSEMSSVKK